MTKAKNKLTSVGVKTEATSVVARLDPVRHSAIFPFVFISSHHIQNHKSADEDANQILKQTSPLKLAAMKVNAFGYWPFA